MTATRNCALFIIDNHFLFSTLVSGRKGNSFISHCYPPKKLKYGKPRLGGCLGKEGGGGVGVGEGCLGGSRFGMGRGEAHLEPKIHFGNNSEFLMKIGIPKSLALKSMK